MYFLHGVFCLAIYGLAYSKACNPGCNYNLCHNTGVCEYGCKTGYDGTYCDSCTAGYYKNNRLCCPRNCKECSQDATCSVCHDGYYGRTCSLSCPANCNNQRCDINYGSCTCKHGYRGYRCEHCSNGWFNVRRQCHKCPIYCDGCSPQTWCHSCAAGYHGQICQNQCSFDCHNAIAICYKSFGNCTDGCINGRRGEYCNISCPSSCKQCSSDTSCSSCLAGYYGTACEFNCSSGCAGQCEKHTGNCSPCKDGYSGSKCCLHNNNCQICYSNTLCSSCVEGFYGISCDMQCPENCLGACSRTTGECTACTMGYYGTKCDQNCLQNCAFCYKDETCDLCNAGFYGPSCNQSCPANCETCLGMDNCEQCKTGFHGAICSNKCPANCVACSSATTCTLCKDGLTSVRCDQKCGGNCQSCSVSYRVSCTKCARGRYGIFSSNNVSGCYSKCSQNCLPDFCDERSGHCIGGCVNGYAGDKCECPENCIYGCNADTGACNYDCKSGFSGSKCSCINDTHRCSTLVCASCLNNTWYYNGDGNMCCHCSGTCKNNQCRDANTCSDGCINGYYGDGCKERCSQRDISCISCTTEGCSQCIEGFYPSKDAGTCIQCSEHCVNGNCSATKGTCFEGCQKGFWGERCDVSCNSHCEFCNRVTGVCDSCEHGLFNRNCSDMCSDHCRKSDKDSICDIDTGQCKLGCINDTIHGNFCGLHCKETCRQHVCNWQTGKCSKGCILNRYGEWCERQCSDSCIYSISDRNCLEVNGSCNLGCKDGYFNSRCDKECNRNCVNRTCERSNGTCTLGCIGGYEGHNCAQALSRSKSINSGAIAGAVAGVCVISVFIVVVVFIIISRRRKRKIDAKENNSAKQETDVTLDVIEPVNRNMPASVSGFHSAPNADRKSTLSKAETTAIENHTPRMHLTLSTISGLDDRIVSVEEQGEIVDAAEGKSTGETYYNFEAISRKGITIDKLSDYVAGKTKQELIEEFVSIPKDFPKPYSDSQKPENLGKNRYRGIYPYDANRVRLHTGSSDYINASYINGFMKEKEYIAALGPIDVTTNHFITFWTMVWQEMVEKIVMLTKLVENTKMKCEQYWPDLGSSVQYGDVSVGSIAEEQYAEFTVRIFTVTKNSEKRTLYHFHYTAWPDKGVPDDVTGLIEFRNKVLAIKPNLDGALIVHCSAGVGRTGTYIALDYLTKEGEETGSVDILACLASLRDQRVYMIQAEEQYIYLHDAVVHTLTYDSQPVHSETFKDHLKTLDTHTLQTKFNKFNLGMDRKDEAEVIAVNRNKKHKTKNHPQADIPGDRHRPKLHLSKTLGDSDYINAVYLDSFRHRNHFVVTQTPLLETIEDFLALICQEKVPCIVDMQSSVQTKTSITEYLPVDGQRIKYGCFEIESVKVKSNEQFVLSRVTLSRNTKSSKEQRTVHHYKYTEWDHRLAVPPSPVNFINFVREAEAKSQAGVDGGKILLHCISGAERSCLFSAVSVMLEKMETEHEVSTVNVIRQIKSRRSRAIPTKEQYLFCHQCVEAFLDTFDTYSNFAARQ